MRQFIKKFLAVFTIIIYGFVMIFGYLPFYNLVDITYAENVSSKDNLVLVLVDESVYNADKSDINWYANYIQQVNKNTKAIVFPINTSLVKATDIVKVINNLYFGGEKNKTSFLKAIVLIGNVPLPVVNKDGFIYPSVYPYVDVVKPAFKYDGKYFTYTGKPSNVEIAHGIIKFDKLSDYQKYFQKLKKYTTSSSDFVGNKFYTDNFVNLGKSLNTNLVKFYLNKFIFAENLIYGKISPLLLQYFDRKNKEQLEQINQSITNLRGTGSTVNISSDSSVIGQLLGFDSKEVKNFKTFQQNYNKKVSDYLKNTSNLINQAVSVKTSYWKVPTKTLESALKGFFKNFFQLFGNEYISSISDNIKSTGRYNWSNTLSILNIVDIKDTLAMNYLYQVNKILEKELDDKISSEQYFMYYPIMVKYTLGDNSYAVKCESTYETFFFGKNVNDINNLSDLTIYRGTYQNYTSLSALNHFSRGKKSSISNVGIFSVQVEANRGYNYVDNSKNDSSSFKKRCSKKKGACIDKGRAYSSETINHWARRIFGGYSPINVNISNNGNVNYYKLPFNYENFKYAWHPIETPSKDGSLFDLAGSVYTDKKFETDNIFNVIRKYNSVWKTNWYTKVYEELEGGETYVSCSKHHYADGSSKVAGNYYDYLKDFSSIAGRSFSLSGNILTVTKHLGFGNKIKTVYKFIDTRFKHNEPSSGTMDKLLPPTRARPVDETGYIAFLGVGGDTVKLPYPDIFSVEVYYKSGNKLVLKTPEEIDKAIKDYLVNLVNDYNKKLKEQLDKKGQFYSKYSEAWSKISNPKYKPHTYNLLPPNYFIDKLGKEKIAKLAEMLYYLNLGWNEKPIEPTLSGELNHLYKGYNIFEKIDYLVKNYMDTEDHYIVDGIDLSHSQLNFPGKSEKGYEAGMVLSKNLDDSVNIQLKNAESQLYAQQLINNGLASNGLSIEQAKEECGRPLGEPVILFEWPAAFMCRLQETLSKPLKIGSTADCSASSQTIDSFKQQLKNLKTGPEQDLGLHVPKGETLKECLNSHPDKKAKYEEWKKLNNLVNSSFIVQTDKSVYDYEDLTGYIEIKPINANINELSISQISIISPSFTGNCLYLKKGDSYFNSCEGVSFSSDTWKIPFAFYNLNTQEGRYWAYKAGQRVINVKFCDLNNVCYTKQIYFTKNPGKLKYVEVKPFSDVMIWQGEDPVVIVGYDSLPEQHVYQNQVKSTYYNYVLRLDPTIGVIKTGIGSGNSQIDFNFDKNVFIVKSNTEPLSVSSFKVVGELDPAWDILSGKVLNKFSKTIQIVKKTSLSSSEVQVYPSMGNITLPDNPSDLYSGDTFDKNKIWKIKIKPVVADRVLKTPLKIENTDDHFIIGTYQNGKFVKKNDFLIDSDSGLIVYAVPTYKTGPFDIQIKIPGISTYHIKGKINPFPVKALYVKLDKYQAEPNEIVKGKIFGVDKFGNLKTDLSGLRIVKSSNIDVKIDGNNLKVKGTKTGWIKFLYKNSEGKPISTIIYFGINSTFIPLNKKISVMYLTLFGYKWGKYASKIMTNSDKNLAITTTLEDPTNLHKFDYLVSQDLSTNVDAGLIFSGGNIVVDFGKIKLSTYQNPLKKIKYKKDLGLIISDGIYYVPQPLDDIIKSNIISNGVLQINNKLVADFNNGTINSDVQILSNLDKTKKYHFAVYDVYFKQKLVGTIGIKGNWFNLSKFKISLPFFTKITYASASTNGPKAFGISISDEQYKGISKNTEIDVDNDKGLGFRTKFRNITNFAAGQDVGDATKPFENEFLINYGDPFVRKISKNILVDQVHVSKTYGYNIYSDIAGGIKKVIPIDFNNDGKKDLIIVYKGNKIRFLKNYAGSKHFEDLGNLMVLAKSIKNVFVGDYDGDGYEDVYIVFDDGTIRVYKNGHGEFDVNGIPVCLDLSKTDFYHLKYTQIFFRDMNNDGKTDIVVNDLGGNVKIFYGDSYLSKILTGCDANFKTRLQQQLVKSYAIKVKPDQKFADAGYIYREGMKSHSTLIRDKIQTAFERNDFSSIPVNSGVNIDNYVGQVMEAGQDKVAYQPIPASLGPSYVDFTGDTIEFKKIIFLTGSDPIKVYKTMEDLNGGNLEYGDKVKITVYFKNSSGKKFTYLEELKGPFGVVSVDDKPVLELEGISTGEVSFPKYYPVFLFRLDGVNRTSSVSYYAIYQGGSQIKIKVGDRDKNGFGEIKVFLKNGCVKGYDYFQGNNKNIPMEIVYSFKDLKDLLKKKLKKLTTRKAIKDTMEEEKQVTRSSLGGNCHGVRRELNTYKLTNPQKSNPWSVANEIQSQSQSQSQARSQSQFSFDLSIGPDISAIQSKINKMLDGLCNGFSIGKAECGGINVPCNYAFFAPGVINACGCPLGIDPGRTVFWFPGTKWISCDDDPCCHPIPMANKTSISPTVDPPNQFKPSPCPGVFPSQIRLYISPTLTASVGIAVCFGSYVKGMHAPPAPVGAIAGNCIVTAVSLPVKNCSKNKAKNADDEEEDWMLDLDNGNCNQLPFKHGIYPISPLDVPSAHSFYASSTNPAFVNANMGGLVNFDMTAHKITSLKDAKVLLKGGIPFHLKVETGTFKGIINCIIKKWLNKQIEFIIANLTRMTVYVVYPNFDDLLDNFKDTRKNLDTDWNNTLHNILNSFDTKRLKNGFNVKSSNSSNIVDIIKAYAPSKKGLNEVSSQLSNPFKQIKLFLKKIPLVEVNTKIITLNIPWIGKDELERQISYLKNWYNRNKAILKKWEEFGASGAGKCEKLYPNDVSKQNQCKQLYANALKVQKFMNSVQKNIEILEKYRNLPLQLYQYVHALDFYINQLLCVIKKYVDMVIGWLDRNSKIFEKWVDAIITIINVIKTWQILIDISVNWKTTCGKCRADNGDLYDCILIGLCPNLPVLPIPPFRIPDIFVDLSHINLGLTVVLPKIKINPVPIGLFTLPDLPYPNLSIELPALPLLPEPPNLPALPALPAVPTFELPNLPPPPMIPKLLPSLRAALNIFKIIGYFRCIIKNGIGLVAEWNVKTRIEQLTARTNRLFPFDFLTLDFPLLPYKGFDVQIDSYLNYNVRFDQLYQIIKSLVQPLNDQTSKTVDDMLEFNLKWNQSVSEFNKADVNLHFRPGAFVPNENVKVKFAKAYLYNQLKYLLSQKDANYLKSLPDWIYEKAEYLLADVISTPEVKPNYEGLRDIQKQVEKLLLQQKQDLEKIKKQIKAIGSGSVSVKLVEASQTEGKNYIFKASLFKASDKVKKQLDFDVKTAYLDMYGKFLNKFVQKLPKYESKHDDKYFMYKQMEKPIEKSLKLINSALGTNYKFATSTATNPIIADPNQFIRGLYMEGNNDTYYNVLSDKKKAKEVRHNNDYVLEDMNNDGLEDMIWWDNYNIYVKYSNDEPEDNGVVYNQLYIYSDIVSNFASIVDSDGYVKIKDFKFKIWDSKLPVNDLASRGNSYEDLSLGWTNSKNVNAYILLYSSRIDVLNDLEKKFNFASDFVWAGENYQTYGIVLYDAKLGKVNEILASSILVNGHRAKNFVYLPIDDLERIDNVVVTLKKDILALSGKWKYFRVLKANLNLEIKQLDILSAYSNQEVGGEQIIGDEMAPILTVNLKRNEVKIVGTGTNLNAYINTHYILQGIWKDDVALKYHAVTDEKYNLITTGSQIKLFETQPVAKIFHFIGIDWNNNKQDLQVQVNFQVPNIQIVRVNPDEGIIVAKTSKDMDISAVKFYVKQNGKLVPLKSINGKEVFTGGISQVEFTGAIFKPNKTVTLYDSDGTIIGSLNLETGIINVNQPYKVYGVATGGLLYTEIFKPINEQQYKSVFEIYIPSNKLITSPEMLNTSKFDLKNLSGANLGEFSDSYCIFDKQAKSCAVYISKDKGKIYVDPGYNFVAKYQPNELGIVNYEFYDIPAIEKSLFTEQNKIFRVSIKPENILKLQK